MDLVQIFNKIGDYASSMEQRKHHLDILVNGARRAYISFDDYVLTSITMGIKDVVKTQPLPKELSELAMWCSDLTSLYANNLVNIYTKGGGLLDNEDVVLGKIEMCFYKLELEAHMKKVGSPDTATAAAYLALNGLPKPK